MRRLPLLLLAALPALACELRVLTWNIHHGEGVDGKLDLARIGAVIREAKPEPGHPSGGRCPDGTREGPGHRP